MATLSDQYNSTEATSFETTAPQTENDPTTLATTSLKPTYEAGLNTNITDGIGQVALPETNVANTLSDSYSTASESFQDSNSLVSKLGFMLVVLVCFLIIVKFGIQFLTSFLNPTKIQVVNGMLNGNDTVIIYQDPSVPNAITLPRSNNTSDGIEFTYSIWLYLMNPTSNSQSYNHIFNKGNGVLLPMPSMDGFGVDGSSNQYIINAPGVYITNTNEIIIIMNTFENINETIKIPNLPLNKWFNLIIRCDDQTFDAFINGNIISSIELLSVPKQNYGNVNLCLNNGFQGYLSNLTYCSYAMGTKEIFDTVTQGPNTTPSKLSTVSTVSNIFSNYLSTRWYFGGLGDMYNPKH